MTGLRARAAGVVEALDDERTSGLLLLAAMAVYAAVILVIGRSEGPFVDEKSFLYVDRGLDPYALLTPLNGHLVAVPRLMYAAVFGLFGADFVPIRILQAIGGSLVAGLFFVLARRRVGAAVALGLSILLLFLGSAWEVTFTQSGITNTWCLAAGIGALLALERGDRRGDLAACALLVVSVACVSFGLAFAVGAGVLILLGPGGHWRRLWIVLVPVGLFLAWLAWVRLSYVPDHGEQQELSAFNLLLIPNFVAGQASAVAGALTGLNYDFENSTGFGVFSTHSEFGPLVAAAAAIALFVRLRRGGVTPMLWALIAILAAAWFALALGVGPGRSPSTVRYAYAGTLFVLMIGVEAARGARLGSLAKGAILTLVVLALLGNIARLRDGARFYRDFSSQLRAQLTAIELDRDSIDPSFAPPAGPASFDQIVAGEYLSAVDRIGSLAFSPAEIEEQSEDVRASLDSTSVAALGIALAPVSEPEQGGDCGRADPGAAPVEIEAAPGTVLTADAPASVAIRRFAEATTQPLGDLTPGSAAAIRLPSDGSSQPWVLSVSPAANPVTVCSREAAPSS